MAHPDHDQFIGRLAGARLRGMADGRAVTRVGPEVHPDAETWAAYVEGGLQAIHVRHRASAAAGGTSGKSAGTAAVKARRSPVRGWSKASFHACRR